VAQQFPHATIDPDRLVYLGHSQGGLTGALALGMQAGFRGAAFSGAGGGITVTLIDRKDILDFEAVIRSSTGIPENEPMTRFHPVLALIQGLADTTDPLSHAKRWFSEPQGPAGVLLLEGLQDRATPPRSAEALATAARLPIIEPVASEIEALTLLGVEPIAAPFSNNLVLDDGSTRTGGVQQKDGFGHFLLFDDEETSKRVANFLRSAGSGEPRIR
jgi:hypothetical protein